MLSFLKLFALPVSLAANTTINRDLTIKVDGYPKFTPVVHEFKNAENPESVYVDLKSGFAFISNVAGSGDQKNGRGWIAKISTKKKMPQRLSPWVKGLNAPKGMRSFNGILWVTDIDRVIGVNISSGKILYRIPIKKAKFLNDLAIDSLGQLYVSDTLASRIYKITKDKKVETFAEGPKYESPNGLLVLNKKLYVASWGLTKDWSTKISGRLYSLDLKTKQMRYVTKKPLGNLDGLEVDKKGNFIVSDWVAGKVFQIKPSGKAKTIFYGMKGSADIGIESSSGHLFIPRMNEGVVSIAKIN